MHAGRDQVTGKVRYMSQTVHGNREDAERELELFATRVRDSPTSPTLGTVGELCDKWWRYTAAKLSRRRWRLSIDQQGIAWGWISRNPASWATPPPRHRPRLQLPTTEM